MQTSTVTRRHVLAAPALLAAQGVPSQLVRRHDENVERLLALQVTAAADKHRGGYPSPEGLFQPGAGSALLDAFTAAFVCPDSRFHRSSLLAQRIQLAAAFLERLLSPDGNVSLVITNFNSPPDTGFVVHGAAGAASLARRYNAPELFNLMAPFLRRATAGLLKGGVHTPNHRWVVCEALAQLNELFPDPALPRRIDQWLAEGIDIGPDGQFTEQSTTVYNPVCDQALLVTALKLNRPALLDPVRRNLDAMLYLLHADGEVVTEISRRQDVNTSGRMSRYWFPLRWLAIKDANPRFARLVEDIEPGAASLSLLLQYPELQGSLPASAPLPSDFERLLPSLHTVRFRRGPRSATLLLQGASRFLTFRNGAASIQAVRMASAFFGKGQFIPTRWEKTSAGYRLIQELESGYYQPITETVPFGQWGLFRAKRKVSELCRLTQSITIEETSSGFSLHLAAAGTPDVPVAVEINLRPGGQLSGVRQLAPDTYILESGRATLRSGADSLTFGPGLAEHSYVAVRGAESKLSGPSVYLCGFTPFRHKLEIAAVP